MRKFIYEWAPLGFVLIAAAGVYLVMMGLPL